MTVALGEFRETIKRLHRTKDAAYRDAWKKRGEVLSILANIARKVDRLEYGLQGAPSTKDESLLDTAVDLFVYCLKYQTFLADIDALVAKALFEGSGIAGSYSEGPAGIEHLLAGVDLTELEASSLTVSEAVSSLLARFSELESCFLGVSATEAATIRSGHVQRLIEATVKLVAALKQQNSSLYHGFLLSNRGTA